MRLPRYAYTGLIVVALALSGCATESGTGTTAAPAEGANADAETADAATQDESSDSAEEDPNEEPEAPANPTFGETYTWEDGLEVTISKPKEFEPSEFAAFEESAAYLSFNVTIVNGGDENYDPVLFSTTMQSGNTEASEVFDTDQGFDGSPMTPLLPGRETKFKIGYGVSNPQDLVMQVSPGFEYDAAIFTN